MSANNKPFSDFDDKQIMQKVYNPQDATLAVGSFVAGQLFNNIQVAYPDAVTENYSYYENTNFLYTISVVYTDSSKANLSSVTRIA